MAARDLHASDTDTDAPETDSKLEFINYALYYA
jgi:hypothetical protein